jgi:hypothetical protein
MMAEAQKKYGGQREGFPLTARVSSPGWLEEARGSLGSEGRSMGSDLQIGMWRIIAWIVAKE